ncbi:MAG: DsrE family protein [Hyphomicrobiaceae bacterium]
MSPIRFRLSRSVLAAGLLGALIASPVMAQDQRLAQVGDSNHRKVTRTAAQQKPKGKLHKLAIQVDESKPEVMNLAINNAQNAITYFKSKGERIAVEIVAFGPGLHMLRQDTSPVKARIAELSLAEPAITFSACGNTHAKQSKAENKKISLITEAHVVPSGVVRLMELQSKGYAYLRP